MACSGAACLIAGEKSHALLVPASLFSREYLGGLRRSKGQPPSQTGNLRAHTMEGEIYVSSKVFFPLYSQAMVWSPIHKIDKIVTKTFT